MKLAEQQVPFQRLMDCGGVELYEEKILRRWWTGGEKLMGASAVQSRAMPSGEDEGLSLATIISAEHVALSRILWVCFHLPSPPVMAMHRASFGAAHEILSRAEAQHIYIDRRSAFALAKKGEWIAGRISLGEMNHAHRRAESALADLSELARDPQELLFAKAACEASSQHVEKALRTFHYTIEEHPFAEKGGLLRRHLLKAFHDQEVIP